MSTFVLVHGAWHGGWCWQKLTPVLEAAGHRVLTPDLPGRGPEAKGLSGLTLDDYADFLSFTLAAENEPVILVGHSLGAHAGLAAMGVDRSLPIRALVSLAGNVWIPSLEPDPGEWLLKLGLLATWGSPGASQSIRKR